MTAYLYSPATGGFYYVEPGAALPADGVPVSAEEHAALFDRLSIGWSLRVSDGRVVAAPPVPPEIPLDVVQARLMAGIDHAAEAERLRYITPGAGQAMTYSQKADEARRCLNAINPNATDYPLLAAEIGITAGTLVDVAQVVAAANAQWLQIGAAIEAARLSAKKSVAEAETVEDARAAAAAVVWP